MRDSVKVAVPDELAKCCDTKSTRYALGSVLVTPKAGCDDACYVAATDCRGLTIVECTGTVPDEVLIPAVTRSSDGEMPGEFPDVQNFIPEATTHSHVTLDSQILRRIAKAIGSENRRVTLLFLDDPTKPVLLLGEHGIGVLMPAWNEDEGNQRPRYNAIRNSYIHSREQAAEKKSNDV